MASVAKSEGLPKAEWGEGAWQHEPDGKEFTASDLICVLVRHPKFGHWCGYIAIPLGHPLYGKGYDAAHEAAPALRVHGGFTYADSAAPPLAPYSGDYGKGLGLWWFGFDCAHAGDYSPGLRAFTASVMKAHGEKDPTSMFDWKKHETYRDITYAERECRMAAKALAGLMAPPQQENNGAKERA